MAASLCHHSGCSSTWRCVWALFLLIRTHSWSCRTSFLEGATFHRMKWCNFLWGNPCRVIETLYHWGTSSSEIQRFFKCNFHYLIVHVIQWRRLMRRLRWLRVSSVPKLAYATGKNAARKSIDLLVWEPMPQLRSALSRMFTGVGKHRSCHMQISSILQQQMVDVLLLVAVDTRHHDSHR